MLHPRLAALFLLVAVVGVVDTVVAAVVEGSTGSHHPPLLDCGPAPTPPLRNRDAAFRTNLSSALDALPSATVSAPQAVATVHFDRAFARSVCYRANVSSSPAAASACNACLYAAARDVTGGCATSARAGVWRDACFLSYADTDASSPREDAFRGWIYAGPTTPAELAGGYCLLDRASDCDHCFHDSARAAAALGWRQRIHGEKVLVVGYTCVLVKNISSSLPLGPDDADAKSVAFAIWVGLVLETAAVMLGMVFFDIIKIVRALPQVNG